METIWFMIVAVMLVCYVVLDGFDIGAGIVHYIVGRTSDEREASIRAVGPVWDGNEVWLLAAGGTLYFAFPVLYSAAFSGFYLPLIMVLWLLIIRAAGIELRHQVQMAMWYNFWDFLFFLSSALLAIFYGAALGNVIRGVPLNSQGYFFEALWTDFRTTGQTGILDWFTVMSGVVSLTALAMHGANYLAHKTEGDMNARARRAAGVIWYALLLLTLVSVPAVIYVRPEILGNYFALPIGWLIPIAVAGSLFAMKFFNARGDDKKAFLASASYLVGMLGGAVYGLYPNVLPAIDPANSLTISNAAAGSYGLSVGLIWWPIGFVIAIAYFTFLFRSFKGKVRVGEQH